MRCRSPEIADTLNRVRQPFNVNSVALAAATAALDDRAHVGRIAWLSTALASQQLRAGLAGLGLGVLPSAANFVLVDLGRPAGPVYEGLLRLGVIARPVGNYGLPNHLRITTGTREQNERFLRALGGSARPAGMSGRAPGQQRYVSASGRRGSAARWRSRATSRFHTGP